MKPNVISFHYKLKNSAGKEIENSHGGEVMVFMEGSGQIIPGLESQMKGMKAGQTKKIEVKAEDAYGDYDDEKIVTVPKSQLPKGEKVTVGQQFSAHSPDGGVDLFTVKKVEGDNVTLDGNHPLAGEDLSFEIEVTEVRAATEEEMTHGHAHGPGGHHHH